MPAYEYKVIPAPAKGTKAKGVKTPQARFANSVEIALNELAAEGWEYLRAELLPSEERTGLASTTTNWRNVLVFRRAIQIAEDIPAEVVEPAQAAPVVAPVVAPPSQEVAPDLTPEPPLTATAGDPEAPASAKPVPGPGAVQMVQDDGVEEVSPVFGLTAALKKRARQQEEDDAS